MQEDQQPRSRPKTYEEKLQEADNAANVLQVNDPSKCQHELTIPVYDEDSREEIGRECSICDESMPWPG